jgi:hypothetical protein
MSNFRCALCWEINICSERITNSIIENGKRVTTDIKEVLNLFLYLIIIKI